MQGLPGTLRVTYRIAVRLYIYSVCVQLWRVGGFSYNLYGPREFVKICPIWKLKWQNLLRGALPRTPPGLPPWTRRAPPATSKPCLQSAWTPWQCTEPDIDT